MDVDAESQLEQGTPARVGLVVHPSRAIDVPLQIVRDWARAHSIELRQVPASCQQQEVAAVGEAADCDLIVSIGGDGTMLAALRAATDGALPVLGIAFGSLGVLTSVPAGAVSSALERFSAGDWVPRTLPALDVVRATGDRLFALNDIAIVRSGQGQVAVRVAVGGTLFARFAGDGCIVSTAVGSSAYALAAGGPLVCVGADAFLLTPLSVHGGFCPPLVVPAHSEVELAPDSGHGGARLEVDGQLADDRVDPLRISFRPGAATIVGFQDQEPFLAGLRRKKIIIDSPRILATQGED
jgi:NAD+ kinase